MRTTLDIDNDVLFAIKDLARQQKKSAGRVISDLARRSLTSQSGEIAARESAAACGFRPLPARGGVVSNKLVDRLREGDVY